MKRLPGAPGRVCYTTGTDNVGVGRNAQGEGLAMRARLAFVIALVLALSAMSSAVTQAATVKDSFDYHIGDGFEGQLNNTGNQAIAENGDTVMVRGNGT